jgi:hypothetical protein
MESTQVSSSRIDLSAVKAKYPRFFFEVFDSISSFIENYVDLGPSQDLRFSHAWHEGGNTLIEMVGDMMDEVVIIRGIHAEIDVNSAVEKVTDAPR